MDTMPMPPETLLDRRHSRRSLDGEQPQYVKYSPQNRQGRFSRFGAISRLSVPNLEFRLISHEIRSSCFPIIGVCQLGPVLQFHIMQKFISQGSRHCAALQLWSAVMEIGHEILVLIDK